MLIENLTSLFSRDLDRLKAEIELYKVEENIWKVEEQIQNSAGNLCLHLVGNLNTYIGKELGGTVYVRNREAEFSLKNISRTELIQQIDNTIGVVSATLHAINGKNLENDYPLLVFETKVSTQYFLAHLAMHLSYHLGQVNYHRRLLDTTL